MKTFVKRFFANEILAYLFFGVATMIISVLTRLVIFAFWQNATLATAIGNILAILFAFVTNDRYVFKQRSQGWPKRFVKFCLSRAVTFVLDLLLAYLFVDRYPQLVGQFVHHDLETVNTLVTLISQVLVIVLNYILSKLFVFKTKKNEAQS